MRIGDAGDVEDLCPPGGLCFDLVGALRRAGTAEHQVVDARLAGLHRRVAIRQRADADDAVGLHRRQRLVERRTLAREMHAVGLGADGEPRVVLDEHRGAALLRERRQRADDRLGGARVARRGAKQHAGDVGRADGCLEKGREARRVVDGRRDEEEARTFDHGRGMKVFLQKKRTPEFRRKCASARVRRPRA